MSFPVILDLLEVKKSSKLDQLLDMKVHTILLANGKSHVYKT